MTISDRDRKVLWGRAANRCSMCKQDLVHPGEETGSFALVGEECHVVSSRSGGPRAREPLSEAGLHDAYANLILLCPRDHSIVDQLVDDFPESRLREVKVAHEAWVMAQLEAGQELPVRVKRAKRPVLLEVHDAAALLSICVGAEESGFSHDGLLTQSDVDEVGGFLQLLHDAGELWDDFEPAARVQAEFDLQVSMSGLREHWRVFGARAEGSITGGRAAVPERWDTAYVHVARTDSADIVAASTTSERAGDRAARDRWRAATEG